MTSNLTLEEKMSNPHPFDISVGEDMKSVSSFADISKVTRRLEML